MELPIRTHFYNWLRPHGKLSAKPMLSVLNLPSDNLLRLIS